MPILPGEELECEFCSLEFETTKEWEDHTLLHFNQKNCDECGTNLICIAATWYSPHNGSSCCTNSTKPVLEVQIPEQILLPDFIEIKQEEIFDVEEENEDDIFNDTEIIDDEEDAIHVSEDNASNDNGEVTEASQNLTLVETNFDQCPLCNMTFENQQSLIEHINQHNGFKAQPYSLMELKNQKDSTDQPAEDILSGLTEEQLSSRKCPICHKIIVNKQNLVCHMNIHRGIKPFVCSVCNKSFAHIRNLIRHKEQQRHCEMQFKCGARGCKKSFMSNNKLHRHVKLAHMHDLESVMEKPYPCDKCEKSFMSLGFLKMHSRRHQ